MLSSPSRALVTLLVLAACTPVSAQTTPPQTPPPQAPPPPTAPATTPAPPAGPSRIHYGVRFGPSFTTLTSVEPFDADRYHGRVRTDDELRRVSSLIDLTGSLSFQPEVLFAAKGQRIRDKDAQPITTPDGELKLPAADRVVLVRYLEFPLLLRLSKHTHENTSLYVIAGPAFALRRNAVIRQVVDSGRHEVIDELVSGSNLSYIFGAGRSIPALAGRCALHARDAKHRDRSNDGGREDGRVFGIDGSEILVNPRPPSSTSRFTTSMRSNCPACAN